MVFNQSALLVFIKQFDGLPNASSFSSFTFSLVPREVFLHCVVLAMGLHILVQEAEFPKGSRTGTVQSDE